MCRGVGCWYAMFCPNLQVPKGWSAEVREVITPDWPASLGWVLMMMPPSSKEPAILTEPFQDAMPHQAERPCASLSKQLRQSDWCDR